MKNAEAAILKSEWGSSKFEDWVGVTNLALLHFNTLLPSPPLLLLMTLNEETQLDALL